MAAEALIFAQNAKNDTMGKELNNKKMFQVDAELLFNKKVRDGYFHVSLCAAPIAGIASPGQFVNIKVSAGLSPLLRRPLSIHNIKGRSIELFYEVVGEGTRVLSERRPGERLDIIGPLGNGFSISPCACPVLIAGGMGTAPIVFLAKRLTRVKNQKSKIKTLVLIGGRTKEDILCEGEFRRLGCEIKIATDDGSRGFKGKVTELFNSLLSTAEDGRQRTDGGMKSVYACGPAPMLKAVAHTCAGYNIPSQLSLEEHMACGIGACLGCAVKTRDGLKRVCKDGPVFTGEEIVW